MSRKFSTTTDMMWSSTSSTLCNIKNPLALAEGKRVIEAVTRFVERWYILSLSSNTSVLQKSTIGHSLHEVMLNTSLLV